MSEFCELLKCMLCCEEEYYEDYERKEWTWTWGRNLFRESPSSETFFTNSDPSYYDSFFPENLSSYYDYHPVCRSDPDTTILGGNVKRRNSSHIGSTRIASSTTLETPFVSLRVPTTPYIPPRVPNNPRLSVEAESLNLSSFSLYPPPSSKSSKLAKPPPLWSSLKQSTASPKPTRPVSKSSPTSSGLSSFPIKLPLPLFKSTLAPIPSTSSQQGRTNYLWVEKGTSPVYVIPNDVEDLIKKDIVPGVLKRPLSPSTYKDYFATLLYAEDFYVEVLKGHCPLLQRIYSFWCDVC